jgi:hypothetical protein
MRYPLCALALVLLAVALVRAQTETYTIKLKAYLDKGQAVKVVEKDSGTIRITVTDPDGKVLRDDKELESNDAVYTDKVVEAGDRLPKKVTRVYGKSTETKGGKTADKSYSGRTIHFELTDGKFKASAEGKPAVEEKEMQKQAKSLTNEAVKVAALVPAKAVKVGERWAISGKDVGRIMGDNKVVEGKSKGEGKLVKVFQKDGKRFGVLEIRLEPFLEEKDGATTEGDISVTLETPIDGSGPVARETGKGKIVYKHLGKDKKGGVVVNGEFSSTVERTLVK